MKLTPFGETARILRMKYDLSLKEMAEAMEISSAHLSGIEYGEKRLNNKHIKSAIAFFTGKATPAQLTDLRDAADKTQDQVDTADLSSDARGLVAAFARRLQQGDAPTDEMRRWLKDHDKGGKRR